MRIFAARSPPGIRTAGPASGVAYNILNKPTAMKQLLTPLLIALGLIGLGLAIKGGIDNLAFNDRVVQVRGLAERKVNANYVTCPVQYSLTGNDLSALYSQVTEKNAILKDFLMSNGITAAEIQTGTPDVENVGANTWSSNNVNFKYKLTSTMTVLTTKVDKVRQLLARQGELLNKGIAFTNPMLTYSYTDLNAIKPEMIAEATKNARKAADQFAQDSDSRIGKIKTAEQGYFSIEDTDPSTPYIKNIRVVTSVTYYLEN